MRRHFLLLPLSLVLCAMLANYDRAPAIGDEGVVEAKPTPAAATRKVINPSPQDLTWKLNYVPAVHRGAGCVVNRGRARAASYEPASLILFRPNTTGRVIAGARVDHGAEGGEVEIYNLHKAGESLVCTLVAPPRLHTNRSDVQPGAPLETVHFSFHEASELPDGDYVARAVRPGAGVEVRFTLTRAAAPAVPPTRHPDNQQKPNR